MRGKLGRHCLRRGVFNGPSLQSTLSIPIRSRAFAAAYRRGQPIVSSERLGKMEVASHLPYLPAQPAVGLPKRSSDVGFGNPAAFRCFCLPSARRPGVLSVG